MKKAIIFLITLVLLMGLSLPVFAASETYQVEQMGITLEVPSEYLVITRDTPATDSIFALLGGTTYETVMKQFEDGNIYLNAIIFERSEEIVVTMTEISLADFSSLGDPLLNTLASALAPEYASYGIQVSKHEIYQHAQTKFIRLYFYDTNSKVYGLQYYTVYDGKAMNFTMRSSEGSLLPVQEQNITAVVDSIRFTDLSNKPLPTEPEPTEPEPTETEAPEPTETGPAATAPAPTAPSDASPAATAAVPGAANAVNAPLTPGTQTSSGLDSTTMWILIGAGSLALVIIVVLIILLCRKNKVPAPAASAVPVTPAPVTPPPAAQVPVEQIPVEQIPMEQVPVEQIPMEQVPVEQIPAEQIPVEQVPVAPIPEPQYQSTVRFCQNCGAELPEGSRFCQNCGAQANTR